MKLYLIHCGYYDEEISDGIYEFHINIPIVANDLGEAKKLARMEPSFALKKMHIDGIQEVHSVNGYEISLVKNSSSRTEIENIRYRDL